MSRIKAFFAAISPSFVLFCHRIRYKLTSFLEEELWAWTKNAHASVSTFTVLLLLYFLWCVYKSSLIYIMWWMRLETYFFILPFVSINFLLKEKEVVVKSGFTGNLDWYIWFFLQFWFFSRNYSQRKKMNHRKIKLVLKYKADLGRWTFLWGFKLVVVVEIGLHRERERQLLKANLRWRHV